MDIAAVAVSKPDDVNLVVGQAHFIKTVEDLHATLAGAVPGLRAAQALRVQALSWWEDEEVPSWCES